MSNKPNQYFALLSCFALLASCGTKVENSSASFSNASSESSSSNVSVSSSESSSESLSESSSGSSTSVVPSVDVEALYGSFEKFSAEFGNLISSPVYGITSYTTSSSYYEKPTTTVTKIDENEVLTTKTSESGVEVEYTGIKDDVFYYVNDNGSFYSSAYRKKIVDDKNDQVSDHILKNTREKTGANDLLKAEKAEVSIKTAIKSTNFDTYDFSAVTQKFIFSDNGDGTYSIEYTGNQTSSYFGCIFHIELDLNGDGLPISGFFKKSNYYITSGQWDKDNNVPLVDDPGSYFTASVSDIQYQESDDVELFDPSSYYATSVTGVEYSYYKADLTTGYTTLITTVTVGEYINFASLNSDNATVSPSTALDLNSMYITKSSDETILEPYSSVFGFYHALSEGTVTLTYGNSFVPNAGSLELTVISDESSDEQEEVSATFSGGVEVDGVFNDADDSGFNYETMKGTMKHTVSMSPNGKQTITLGMRDAGSYDEGEIVITKTDNDPLGLNLEYTSQESEKMYFALTNNGTLGTGSIKISTTTEPDLFIELDVTVLDA